MENLEWCTDSENMVHAALRSTHFKNVSQYSLNDVFIMSFESIWLANICTDISGTEIDQCCKGKAGHAGGYKWKYTL